ncbi:MAG TPA: hypothetical protein DD451_02470 [Candidatus Moranbacteria bacterium]|nr:hypothetical protein [Candidatus Moranbacteria bacterium]
MFFKYAISRKTLLGIFTIGLVLIFGSLIKNFSFPDQNWNLEKGKKIGISSEKNEEVIQKFIASKDNLSRIDIFLGNSKIERGGTLQLELFNKSCEKLLRKDKIRTTRIKSENFFTFTFPKIQKTANEILCIKLSFYDWNSDKNRSAQVFVRDNILPENVFFSINQEIIKGKSLSMRPAYQENSWRENIWKLSERISQYKPWFLKNMIILSVLVIAIISSILLVVIIIFTIINKSTLS